MSCAAALDSISVCLLQFPDHFSSPPLSSHSKPCGGGKDDDTPIKSVPILRLVFRLGLLLGPNELGIVDEPVPVHVVHLQDGVDQGHQLLVREDLLLHLGRLWLPVLVAALLAALLCNLVVK